MNVQHGKGDTTSADPGFGVRGGEIRRGVLGDLDGPKSCPGRSPGGGGEAPRTLLQLKRF